MTYENKPYDNKPSDAYPTAPPPSYNATYDESAYLPENEGGMGISSQGFESADVRRVFIRKVYSVLTVQLFFTAGVIALFNNNDAIQDALGRGSSTGLAVMWTCNILFMVTYFCLVCPCCNFQRKYPLNIIFLALLTIAMSLMTAVITCYYSTSAVLQAFGTTAGIVLTVTGLTFWSKFDITKFWMIFFIIPPLMLFSWLFAFISGSSVAITVYCAIGVVAFTIYLAFDTKMIMGGGRLELSPDDWIVAVVQLYVDIIQIFLYLLQLFGRSD